MGGGLAEGGRGEVVHGGGRRCGGGGGAVRMGTRTLLQGARVRGPTTQTSPTGSTAPTRTSTWRRASSSAIPDTRWPPAPSTRSCALWEA